MSVLAIDCGNSRCKWGLFSQDGELLEHAALSHAELAHGLWPSAERVIIAMVGGQRHHLQKRYPNAEWFTTQSEALGLMNGYQPAQSLGCDRWAAAIAAWQMTQGPALIVNAGTATTVDAITGEHGQGLFLGGDIVAGLDLLVLSLTEHCAGLASVPVQTRLDWTAQPYTFTQNTQSAIRQGALQATLGLVRTAFSHLSELSHSPPALLLCGGNAGLLAAHLPTAKVQEHLVLQGLYLSQGA